MKIITLISIFTLFASLAFCQADHKTLDTARLNPNVPSSAFRMHYDDLFRHNADNTVSPMQPLEINGEMINTSTKILNGVQYGGVYLSNYSGHDMLVDTVRGVVIIRKFLK